MARWCGDRATGGYAHALAGIGLDLLRIDRLERALERRPALAERLFTDGERRYAQSQSRPGQHLAARFCAKEAVTKALRLDVLRPLDIEVLSGDGGVPELLLHGAVAEHAAHAGLSVEVSLTHEGDLAAAVAVAA